MIITLKDGSKKEYAESKSRIYDEEVILSSGYFGSFFPQVSSYFTTSIFNDLLDILNPLFVSCNLKTLSPSVVPVDGRIYINMTAFEKMMQDPEFKKEYEALKPEFELKKQLIEARIKSKLTQEQIATKMNMKQANLARFEKSLDARFSTIIKYARALGLKELKIGL